MFATGNFPNDTAVKNKKEKKKEKKKKKKRFTPDALRSERRDKFEVVVSSRRIFKPGLS